MQDSAQPSVIDRETISDDTDRSSVQRPWVEEGRGLAEMSASWRAVVKDPLTGLFSRNALLTFTDDAIPYFKRYRRSVGILFVEIDRLSSIMETHGIANEGHVLRHVAEVLDFSVRTTDKVARFDVERFIILLREVDDDDTVKLADRIRRGVEDLGVRHLDRIVPLTVSIGAAIVADSDVDSAALIGRAETALDDARLAGGNRVVLLPGRVVEPCPDAA